MGLEGSIDVNNDRPSSRSVWVDLLVTILWLLVIWIIMIVIFRTIQNIDQMARDVARIRQYFSTLFLMSRVNGTNNGNSSGLERQRPRQVIGVEEMHDPL